MLTIKQDPLEKLVTLHTKKLEAKLFSISVYKGLPRKELDEAWKKLVDRKNPTELNLFLSVSNWLTTYRVQTL